MAFLTMSMAEIFHSFNMRSQRSSLFTIKKQNVVLWLAAAGTLLLTTLVCEVGFLANAFGFTTIGWEEYGIALGIGFCIIPIVEIVKLFQRIFARRKAK
jgi:Ca2+-transporting ATPase